jgi:hypothetical protein
MGTSSSGVEIGPNIPLTKSNDSHVQAHPKEMQQKSPEMRKKRKKKLHRRIPLNPIVASIMILQVIKKKTEHQGTKGK